MYEQTGILITLNCAMYDVQILGLRLVKRITRRCNQIYENMFLRCEIIPITRLELRRRVGVVLTESPARRIVPICHLLCVRVKFRG